MATSVLEQIVADNPVLVCRLNVNQLQGMLKAGVFADGEPVELIDGLLVHKDRRDVGGEPMTHGPRHASAIRALAQLARQLEPAGYAIQLQLPIALSAVSQPEPDGTILRAQAWQYHDRHPSHEDVVVVIEVADSSLQFDRTTKLRLYASSAIPSYWIVNLRDNVVEVYSQVESSEGRYRELATYTPGSLIAMPLGDQTLHVDAGHLLALG